ncbi:MAG: hypothetical protein KY476_22470 [Planctomycetes bacterium]|nr:hypothetical protein [Planctomycetota bacterium]
MAVSDFIGYVGPADIHDGTIEAVEVRDDLMIVRIRPLEGERFSLCFSGVENIRSQQPEGMLLYALAEMMFEPPLRRFVFANWDAADQASLEVVARDFTVVLGRDHLEYCGTK